MNSHEKENFSSVLASRPNVGRKTKMERTFFYFFFLLKSQQRKSLSRWAGSKKEF